MDEAAYASEASGILLPKVTVAHRDHKYDSDWFEALHETQSRHFRHSGRFRFLLSIFLNEYSFRRNHPRVTLCSFSAPCCT
jgi:hypothetical protein